MAELTDAEAAVYDRQLRVWGVEVQKRLRSARVLIVGCSGLAAEVAKNVVLAGVGSLHLMDDTPSTQAAPSNFLNYPNDPGCSVAEASARSLREMNPMVSTSCAAAAEPSHELAHKYDVILVVGRPLGTLVPWDAVCREAGTAFFGAVSRGSQAFFFADLSNHTFQPAEVQGQAQKPQTLQFASLAEALQQSWGTLSPTKTHKLLPVLLLCAPEERKAGTFCGVQAYESLQAAGRERLATASQPPKLLQAAAMEAYLAESSELAPVNAIVGGVLANEMLKAVSKKGEPFNNLFLYSMADGGGVIERLSPPAN